MSGRAPSASDLERGPIAASSVEMVLTSRVPAGAAKASLGGGPPLPDDFFFAVAHPDTPGARLSGETDQRVSAGPQVTACWS